MWNKAASLRAYAHWMNEIARASFLRDQGHPEMFFFITDRGELTGCQFREGLDSVVKNATIQQESARIQPYGTIHTKVVTVYKLPGEPMVGSEPGAEERPCLLVRMESRKGGSLAFASPILQTDGRLALEQTVVLQAPI